MKKTLSALFLSFVFFAPQVQAGMIATEAATQSSERARLNTLLQRPELAQALEKLGLTGEQAQERVKAMSDAEVASLAGQVDAAIAGGAMSNTDLIIVLLIVLLVVVLL